jgi:hypothetical protein
VADRPSGEYPVLVVGLRLKSTRLLAAPPSTDQLAWPGSDQGQNAADPGILGIIEPFAITPYFMVNYRAAPYI